MPRPRKVAVKAAPAPAPEAAAVVRKVRTPLPQPDELRRMIETGAYFKAQKDGFRGNPAHYWSEAEKEIRARFQ